nr:lysozyme inhibitor LprI family protein [Halomonas socia]
MTHTLIGQAVAALLLAAPLAVVAEDESPPTRGSHPIDHKTDSCMEEGEWRTPAMLACAADAYDDWQAEVERLASRLSGRLGNEARDALELAQQQWALGRDADFAFIAAYYADLKHAEEGYADDEARADAGDTPWSLAEQLRRNAVLEDRAYQLQRYLDGLEELPGRTRLPR